MVFSNIIFYLPKNQLNTAKIQKPANIWKGHLVISLQKIDTPEITTKNCHIWSRVFHHLFQGYRMYRIVAPSRFCHPAPSNCSPRNGHRQGRTSAPFTGPGGLMGLGSMGRRVYIGLSPLPVKVTTRIITFLVGDPYKPSFATVTGRGDNPRYIFTYMIWLKVIWKIYTRWFKPWPFMHFYALFFWSRIPLKGSRITIPKRAQRIAR